MVYLEMRKKKQYMMGVIIVGYKLTSQYIHFQLVEEMGKLG